MVLGRGFVDVARQMDVGVATQPGFDLSFVRKPASG